MSRFGLSAALSTPFTSRGEVDIARLIAHAKWCLTEGCDSLTLFGTTGEGASIGLTTRDRVFDAMLDAGIPPRTQLLTSVVASSVEDAAVQARQALERDFRGLLLTPPFYFRAIDDDGIFRWFAQVFELIGPQARDMFVYHLPSVTGISLSVDLIDRLKKAFPGIVVGVKDSSSTWANTEALLARHADLMILVGDERDLARAVRGGGSGSICGVANVAPRMLRPVAREGREDARIRPLVDAICRYPVLAALKTIIAHQKGDAEWRRMRAPMADLDPALAKVLLADALAAISAPAA